MLTKSGYLKIRRNTIDRSVNILDITIVATAYGSKQGEPKYNELADLDENGQINILDISMVAKDYGKTA